MEAWRQRLGFSSKLSRMIRSMIDRAMAPGRLFDILINIFQEFVPMQQHNATQFDENLSRFDLVILLWNE